MLTDGLRAYRTFINRHADLSITPVSCPAHISRKLKESRDDHPPISPGCYMIHRSRVAKSQLPCHGPNVLTEPTHVNLNNLKSRTGTISASSKAGRRAR